MLTAGMGLRDCIQHMGHALPCPHGAHTRHLHCRHTAREIRAGESDDCQRCNSVAEVEVEAEAEAGGRAGKGRQGGRAVGMQGGDRDRRRR